MDKKARSKPMVAILTRLNAFKEFEIINFGDDLILNQPCESWPSVDCLIAFYSEGFPLAKVEAYVQFEKSRNPNLYCINDLPKQYCLLDRRLVYRTLKENNIPLPGYIEVNRSDDVSENNEDRFEETEDSVSLDGITISKPFVEKPASGEDHNIWIYYPSGGITGGGVKKLFRKTGDKSSEFYPEHPGHVRKEGSFIYEGFMQTAGTDVKVYTVGPHYAHAEARKSPVVDGCVERFADGKERRYPVLLTPAEKDIAKKVQLAFGQFVCGFDLLRSEGKSYVCDVNGWSFVKNSAKYYSDAAEIMRKAILLHHDPQRLLKQTSLTASVMNPSSSSLGSLAEDMYENEMCGSPNYFSSYSGSTQNSMFFLSKRTKSCQEPVDNINWHDTSKELRAVIAIMRHGDRTPKQKMKIKVTQKPLLDLMQRYGGGYVKGKLKQAKLKKPHELQALLDVLRDILITYDTRGDLHSQVEGASDDEEREFLHRIRLAKQILERGGSFSGINRKVQLKPTQVNYKNGAKEGSAEAEDVEVVEALLILKHGGVLTEIGRNQGEELGARFRKRMYPQGAGGEGDGLLRLHSTYRHDLKIYSSDEGRVQMTAAAFTKGLLDLEGDSLVPILVSLVNKDEQVLDAFGKGVSEIMQSVKVKLHSALTGGVNKLLMSAAPPGIDYATGSDTETQQLVFARSESIKSPIKSPSLSQKSSSSVEICGVGEDSLHRLEEIYNLLKSLCDELLARLDEDEDLLDSVGEGNSHVETLSMIYERWRVLMQTFYKRGKFNISKIPDIYDSAKFDLLHNKKLDLIHIRQLHFLSKQMADIVVPNEYGVTNEERLNIGQRICSELLGKILRDFAYTKLQTEMELQDEPDFDGEDSMNAVHRLAAEFADDIKTPERHVRTRIYFTSESHIHALINVLRYGAGPFLCNGQVQENPIISDAGLEILDDTKEFDYLSQIVFRVFENLDEPSGSPSKFTVDVLFSPGTIGDPSSINDPETEFLPAVPLRPVSGENPESSFRSEIHQLSMDHFQSLIRPFATHKRKESFFHAFSPPKD